jgi:hypothetical protein
LVWILTCGVEAGPGALDPTASVTYPRQRQRAKPLHPAHRSRRMKAAKVDASPTSPISDAHTDLSASAVPPGGNAQPESADFSRSV